VEAHRVRVGAALLAVAAVCAWPSAGSAQVLYRTSARISRLTVSGGRMAWAEQVSGSLCSHLYRRRVSGTTPTRVTKCRYPSNPYNTSTHPWIRLIGPHVFWEELGTGNTEVDEFVYSTLPGGHRSRVTYTILCGGLSGGGKLLGAVSARALVYSVFTVRTDGACDVQSGTGVVRRTVVAGGHASRVLVPGAPGADMLAVSGRSLLEVPAVLTTGGVGPGTTLELRGLHSGNRRWSSAFTGAPRAIAVSPSYAATLVRTAAGALRIRAYATATGALAASLPVRSTILPMLAMVGPRVVFAYTGRIMVWNVRAHTLRTLRRVGAVAHNLVADGRLVAWNTHHAIRGVRLPPAR
jgi:hypothetical protein